MIIVFADGESEIELGIDDEGNFSLRRPNKGMTPFLDLVIDEICENDDLLGNETETAKNFLRQSEEMSILIGEERCG